VQHYNYSIVSISAEDRKEHGVPENNGKAEEKSLSGMSSLIRKILLGFEPTPELMAILLVYFVQGALGLSRLAVSFFLKDELGLTPAAVAGLSGLITLPWLIKPVYGFLSDGLPLFGYRRRSYLVVSGLLGTGAWLSLATLVHDSTGAIAASIIASLSVAIGDVIADSLVVERVRVEDQAQAGNLQSLCWGTAAVGGLMSAYFSGSLLEHFSTRTVFALTAVFPLLTAAVAFLVNEQPVESSTSSFRERSESVKEQVVKLWEAVSQKNVWLPALFIFLWQASPSADSAMFFFATNELGFRPEFLGRVRLFTSMASLFGVWLYQHYLNKIPIRSMFTWTTLLSVPLGLTSLILVTHANRSLGIPDQWFSLGDSVMLTVLGQIAFMPVLVLAAQLCPPGVEATLFALLMSGFNGAGAISSELGALLTHALGITDTNFDHLWQLLVITCFAPLLPLTFVNWLPSTVKTDRETVLDKSK